ncbi:ribosomal protein L13 [Rhizodiscina lignyota]|uniref:Ribosomal protein L13 n=1 Tax=Rhizodiscina lignyota TaxID=1504668 RepID=A0A9P4I8W6_9PEZI|nr:ribosomal protein L13 [Rhizodiscina lignyota]
MSQTIGRTRLAYSRAWHHLSLSPTSSTWAAPVSSATSSATSTSPSTPPSEPLASIDPPPLGRIASRIALLLMGKHKPIYDPSTDCGDYVVVTSCSHLRVTGNKLKQKKYYTHTTRPGSLQEISLERLMEKWGGGEILRRAVKGMLPKNKLQDTRLMRLRCFEGEVHPYKENFLRFAADEPTRKEVGMLMGETPGVMVEAHSKGEAAKEKR